VPRWRSSGSLSRVRTVSWISIAPVKGLRLRSVDSVQLEQFGVAEDRRFYLIDTLGDKVGALELGKLVAIEAGCTASGDRLTLRLPSGEVVDGEIELGEAVETNFYGRPVAGHVVEGPWSEAISSFAERPLRLVRTDEPGVGVDRDDGVVSLVSEASLEELAQHSGPDGVVDARRFRMTFGVSNCRPHEEDEWIGREVRVGDAVVRPIDTIARCAITTKDPDSGERDFDALGAIRSYRGQNQETMGIDFGVFGEVLSPGRVRVGDPVEPQ
jgi:uncharacterized protein